MIDLTRYKIEDDEKWREIAFEIPFFELPKGYKMSPIPPFAGAVARFRVMKPNGEVKSVYLDWYDKLGYRGAPYWEVYPVKGDTARFDLTDTKGLVKAFRSKG